MLISTCALVLAAGLTAAPAADLPETSFTIWDWTRPCADLAIFETWAADLKALGFDCIEISAPWRLLEPEPGRHDFSFIAERLAVCKRLGLALRVRMNSAYPAGPPPWYDGDCWQDASGARVLMGLPSICDERFWNRFAPCCTAAAAQFKGEGILFSPFIGVHAELKWADWWSFDPATRAFWRRSIAAPRSDWLRAVTPDDAVLPETPPIPPDTAGLPDTDPVHRAVIAFREAAWCEALGRFTAAIRAGDPDARISVPLGESYRRQSALMSNLDYFGLSRGAQQVVHSFDFFWHAHDPEWMAGASVAAFRGITGLPAVFELDGPNLLTDHGYTPEHLLELGRAARDAGAGLNVANWSYTDMLPSQHEVIRDFAELWKEPNPASAPLPTDAVLLFCSKWAAYSFRESTEWLHDAQFGTYKLLRDLGVPVRIICEDNLAEDLRGARALVIACSPPELLPESARARLEALDLPRVADVARVPDAQTVAEPTYTETPAGRACVALPGCPVTPVPAESAPGRAVLGYPIGYLYVHGTDPEAQRAVMHRALTGIGVPAL